MRLRRRHPRLDRRPFGAGRTLGRFVAALFAALFALQGVVAVAHTHLPAAGAQLASVGVAETGKASGEAPQDHGDKDAPLCEVCLAAAAFAHAPPATAPDFIPPVPVETRPTVLAEAPAPLPIIRAARGARAPPTTL